MSSKLQNICHPYYLLVGALILLGFFLRLINLGAEPYWGDEVLSLDIVKHYQHNLSGLITYLNWVEVHPPLYYLSLGQWTKLFGWQEFGVRLLSLIFGLGIILLVYWLVLILFKNKKIALLGSFFTAILPFQIEFSQEARPYIIFCFFAILATIAFWRYQQSKQYKFLALYILSNLIGLYLHYSYSFVVFALATYWLIIIIYSAKSKHKILDQFFIWFLVHSFILIAYFYQLRIILYKIFLGHYLLFNTPRSVGFWHTPHQLGFFENIYNQLIWLNKANPISTAESLGVLAFKLALIGFLVWLLFVKQSPDAFKRIKLDSKALFFVFYLCLIPVVLFLLAPYSFVYSRTFERHVIASSVFLVILLAYLISLFKGKYKLLLISLFIISLLNSLVITLGNDAIWDDYHRIKSVTAQINLNYRPGDLVLVDYNFFRTDVNHFLKQEIPSFALYPVSVFDYHFDFLSSRQTLGLNENEKQLRLVSNKSLFKPSYKKNLDLKMAYIINKYHPQRIWFYSMVTDQAIKNWFAQHHWRLAMQPLGPLHPLSLLVKIRP